tara:strand:+ start:69 stop:773 length:705 start_codon:yes stop_codon:yes gene_type:complete
MHLLHYTLTGDKLSEGLYIHKRKHRWKTRLQFPTDVDILTDPTLLRILIMRNPYDRVLSAYNDFLMRNPLLTNTTTFHNYVTEYILKDRNDDNQFPDHRTPITSGCNIWEHNSGTYKIEWDYILKLEESWLWSSCIFAELNLVKAVSQGWPTKTGELFHIKSYEDVRLLDVISYVSGRKRWPTTKALHVGHERSTQKWNLYTPELVNIVNKKFQLDFQVGGYALWDGSATSAPW